MLFLNWKIVMIIPSVELSMTVLFMEEELLIIKALQ